MPATEPADWEDDILHGAVLSSGLTVGITTDGDAAGSAVVQVDDLLVCPIEP